MTMRMSAAAASGVVVGRFREVHVPDDADVVVRADHREQHADGREPDEPGVQHGLQHDELRVEADERRHAGHAEHDHQHDEREPRAARVQAFEVLEALGFEAAAAQEDHHAEGRGRHQHVRERVEHRGREPVARCRR